MLSTNGENSFAIFNYGNKLSNMFPFPFRIGFDAGDEVRMSDVPPDSLQTANNVFRIDGRHATLMSVEGEFNIHKL